jgi:hypothetical protein
MTTASKDATLPSPTFAFESFFSELTGYYEPLARDFKEAMEARRVWGEASRNLMPENYQKGRIRELSAEDFSVYMQGETTRMMQARPIANLRAAGILITLYSILEELQNALGVSGFIGHGFGSSFNGIAFSALLQAGANSSRHGKEWWRCALRDYQLKRDAEWNRTSPPTESVWSKQQLASITPIMEALARKDPSEASNQPAVDVLAELSSDLGYDGIHGCMIDVATDIAIKTGTLKGLETAATRLGIRP